MLVSSNGFQSYPNSGHQNLRQQTSFGQQTNEFKTLFDHYCTLPADELKGIVDNLTKRLAKHPYHGSLEAKLRDAKAALEKVSVKTN